MYLLSYTLTFRAPDKDAEESLDQDSPEVDVTSNRSESTSKGMWGDRYLKRILANLSIRIDNLILRYSHEYIHCVLTSKVQLIYSLTHSTLRLCPVVLKIIGNTVGKNLEYISRMKMTLRE